MADRKSLTTLSERLAIKTSSNLDSEPSSNLDSKIAPVRKRRLRRPRGVERVQIIVRMTANDRKALRQIALDQGTTAQALAEDAIRNVLRRHGVRTD